MNKNSIRQKLVSATAMLIVASILMVSTSYAWFVMSTAPEVSNIQTQVGANGALEVALLNSESWDDLTLLDRGDIDESADELIASANLTWGNLVNMDDSTYGLSQIVLNPSRLYIEESGTDSEGAKQYALNSVLLKTPIYGEDGRIIGLDKESAINRICVNGQFTGTGYGVRAIGTSASMSTFQLGMNSARANILTAMSSARTAASNALSQTGSDLAGIVITYGVSNKTTGYTANDVNTVKRLATGLQVALDRLDSALRAVFAGYITTSESGISSEDYASAAEAINNPENSLSELLNLYSGITNVIPQMNSYVQTLSSDQQKIISAIDSCDALLAQTPADGYTWDQISHIIEPLMNTESMKVNGQTVDELKGSLMENGEVNLQAAIALISNGITIEVPSGSGVLSDISDFAGDYTAKVSVSSISYNNMTLPSLEATMTTKTTANPVYLSVCNYNLSTAEIADASGVVAITDFFGYAIDLAFRTNAQDGSNLLLQTRPENRVYEGSTENEALQGAGSFMSFRTEAGISATKMVRLMQGLRVVFADKNQNILAIAALDCMLGKDVYETLPDEERTDESYAYLKGGAGAYQLSDIISKTEYDDLAPASNVEFDSTTGDIKALLYLKDFSMTISDSSTETETKYTGGTTVGENKAQQIITSLVQDQPKVITALVYLDGSYVTNAMVAANAPQSMTGVLNLQFASDADLIPAEITKLRSGSDENDSTQNTNGEEPGDDQQGDNGGNG